MKIDKDIPFPPSLAGAKSSYPWKELEVGDSFFTANGNTKTLSVGCSVHGARMGRKFRARKVDGGTRVWRIE